MRTMTRVLATVGVAAATAVGGTTVAQAEGPVQEFFCGSNYDYCVQQNNLFAHNGFKVSEVWYRQGQTCPGGGGCGDGWLFNWRDPR